MEENIILNTENKITEITLNRPQKMNAITIDLMENLKNKLR